MTTNYQYVSGKLMYEECNGAEKYYFYDSNGVISGIRYYDAQGNMTMIYVVTNSQGDVIALYDRNGNAVVEYQYDAWGNIISTTNTTEGSSLDWNEVNPFRYRGYYYDSETGLYYLNSRYYDSETGRFLNSDALIDNRSLTTINPFVYCGNNPVNYFDPTGFFLDRLWEGIKKSFSYVESKITQVVDEVELVGDFFNWFISIKEGTRTSYTKSIDGDTNKPCVLQFNRNTENFLLSSLEYNINYPDFSVVVSLGTQDTGVFVETKNNNLTKSYGVKADFTQLKIGFERSTSSTYNNVTVTEYTNSSVTGLTLACAFAYVLMPGFDFSPVLQKAAAR